MSHYELGKLLVSPEQFKPAAQELSLAVTHDPTLSAAYYRLTRVYARGSLRNLESVRQPAQTQSLTWMKGGR